MQNKIRIIDKVNEGQESDVIPFTWDTISDTLKSFWDEYFNNLEK